MEEESPRDVKRKLARSLLIAIQGDALATRKLDLDTPKEVVALRTDIDSLLNQASDSLDLEEILTTERFFVSEQRRHVAPGKQDMMDSLNNALDEIDAALTMVAALRDPDTYRTMAKSYIGPKFEKDGLPIDPARKFFLSHATRLDNLHRNTTNTSQRKVVNRRKALLDKGRVMYIDLQRHVLGSAPEGNAQSREAGFAR